MYLFTDFFYLLLITIIPYRRKVVRSNIERSFPDKSKKEHRRIEHRFYRHLSNLLAEGTKNLSINGKCLQKRFKVENPELMEELYKEGKDVLLVSGHYNNWEWLITAQNLLFKHQAVGIGMPLTSTFWDKTINNRRARFGMKIIHSKITNDFFKNNKETIATLVLFDQSPGDERKCYWMEFLHQETGVIFGPEMLANKFNQAVVYFEILRDGRGYYKMKLTEVTRNPRELNYGEITERCTRMMEQTIQNDPPYWIWSHKRWKKHKPANYAEIYQHQKEEFERAYR
ncbi:MAG: lysophospholipid acyltransferase family protein [Brumimicrobium sp.]|nr:lysophospholipid acyltransferase family protein [Brumimicrobium sp.]